MLLEKYSFSIARFPSLQKVDWSEVQKADFVQIGEFVKGGIYHSEFMIWRGSLAGLTSPEEAIKSKRESRNFEKSQQFFDDLGYEVKVVPMTEELFFEFKKLYDDTTMVRERPLRFDLETQVLGKIRVDKKVFLVGMFETWESDGATKISKTVKTSKIAGKPPKQKLISGLIFSVFNDKVTVSFGAKRKFKVRGGAGGMLERHLAEFCLKHGYTDITHGTTTNPAGVYSEAGGFEFKARYGYSAFPMGKWYTTFVQNPKVSLSNLVFVGLVDGQVGYTIVSDEDEKELRQKYVTKDVNKVKLLTSSQARRGFGKLLEMRARNVEGV